ncbi:MAG: threonylcarbamoyl-AMP synthase [Herpetosiphonaceae bacterium]|nr:threonylcarbamoyl-AMP synthase [Herpetosiphonaceae bacterium]
MQHETVLQAFDQGSDLALQILRQGGVIGFPTDTVYGVGAAGYDARAVAQLFDVKERPRSQAIPLLLADPRDLGAVTTALPPLALELARRYWPGGLTLVVPAQPQLPPELLGGGTTVAVRVPDHPALRQLIRDLGQPLAATSGNLHGAANPITAQQVLAQLGGRLPLILDGGATPGDLPSTVVDVTGSVPRLLRQGVVTLEL